VVHLAVPGLETHAQSQHFALRLEAAKHLFDAGLVAQNRRFWNFKEIRPKLNGEH
jgi:hypothetical protein